ncbi:MAG TPA: FtsX-like permease family protein [Thermomicrobiales bacterium]|nr:FtsX-like permease family protein [Thermomicrobiales bacterium]
MRTLVSKVLRDLRLRPLRNLLTILGIVLGVAGVVAISATARSIADAQRLTYANSRQADLATFANGMSATTANLVERQPNVVAAETRSVTFTRFDTGTGWQNLRLVGLESFDQMQLDLVEVVEGRVPQRGEVAFDESSRELAPIELGTVVAIRESPADPLVYVTVVGFTRSPATLGAGLMNRATAYVPAATVRELTGMTGDNYLLVRVEDQQRASQTAAGISRLLSKRGVSLSSFDVRDPDAFVGSRELGTLLLLLRVFSWLGAALSSVLVANTLAAVMGEEMTQIGIIKSVGGQRRQIILTYLLYGSILGVIGTVTGWLAGLAIGQQISGYLTRLTGLQQPAFTITAREIGLALLVGTLVTLTASLLPVIANANARVASLLRTQGVRNERTSQTLLRVSAPLAHLSVAAAVGMRNALRRPRRTLSTILVVTVAVAAFVATQALSRSVSGTVDELYALYGADGWVSYERPVGLDFASVLAEDPWITEVEPWTSASGAIGSTRTDIWGMPADDPLYSYRLLEGTWVRQSNPPSAVLTSNLAAAIGARVGDWRELDVGQKRETVQIVGIVNDSSTYLGNAATGKLFMRVEDVNRLHSLGQQADVFAYKLTASDPDSVDTALAEIEERTRAYGPVTYSSYSDQQSSRQAIGILTLMLNAMVVVVAVVGVSGIANTLLISIAERRREFGVMRAIGAGTRQIVTVLVSEGLMLALLGLIIGTIAGYPLARLLVDITSAELFDLTFYLSPASIVMTFVVALLTVAAVSALPGLVAARIRPIQVLRYE